VVSSLPPPDADERAMLECVLSPETNSRLSCQITVSDDLDGIILHIPEKQM
jgi:2Fe-2S ferredoxin